MALASPRALLAEWNSQGGCHQGELQLLLALGDSPRSARGVWPRLLSDYCFCCGSWNVEILCTCFKNGVSLSYNPLALLKISPLAFKARCSGGSSSQCGSPGLQPDVGLETLAPQGEPLQLSEPRICRSPAEGSRVLTIVHFCPSPCGSCFISLGADDLFR